MYLWKCILRQEGLTILLHLQYLKKTRRQEGLTILLHLQYLNILSQRHSQCPVFLREQPGNPNKKCPSAGPDQPLRHVRHVPRGPRSKGARGITPSDKNSIIASFTREHLQQKLFCFILTVCRWLTLSPYH